MSNAPAIAAVTSSDLLGARFNLYNGNISYMGTNLIDPTDPTYTPLPNGMAYKYDQLNRIKYAQGYDNLDITDNTWDYG